MATPHYIREGATGGLNNGTSWANAWTSFSSVTWTRDHIYYIAGGTYSRVSINTSLSGALWIYIKKANAADNGSDAGWDPTYATTVALITGNFTTELVDLDRGFISIDGVTGSDTSGHGIHILNTNLTGSAKGIHLEPNSGPYSITHCDIEGSGSASTDQGTIGVYWTNFTPKKNNYFAYNWIHEWTTNGVVFMSLVGTSFVDYGLLFEYNVISETGRCTNSSNHGQGMQIGQQSEMGFVVIRNNKFRNNLGSAMIAFLGGVTTQIVTNSSVTVDASAKTFTLNNPGGSWIASGFAANRGVLFSNFRSGENNVYGIISALTSTVMTFSGSLYNPNTQGVQQIVNETYTGVFANIGSSGSDHHDIEIYNNLFYLTDPLYNSLSPGVIWAELERNGNQNVMFRNAVIANNTFFGISGSGGGVLGQITIHASGGSISVWNNIWENCYMSAGMVGVTSFAKNGFYGNSGAGIISGVSTATSASASNTGIISGSSSALNNPNSYDFTLKPVSYAIGAGFDLSSLFTGDFIGANRSVPWDLGAYSYYNFVIPITLKRYGPNPKIIGWSL